MIYIDSQAYHNVTCNIHDIDKSGMSQCNIKYIILTINLMITLLSSDKYGQITFDHID